MADANPTPAPAPAPPPPAANTSASTGTQTSTGTGTGTGTPPQSGLEFLFPLIAMGILFWLFIIRPETKRRKEKDAVMNSLKVKDEVVTIFGLYGTIVSIEGDDVVLNIDAKKDVKMRLRRSAIDSVVAKEEKK